MMCSGTRKDLVSTSDLQLSIENIPILNFRVGKSRCGG